MPILKVTVPPVWNDASKQGVVVNWFYGPGAPVEEGDVLAECMVEKANFEVTAPASGTLVRILAPVDTPIQPGTPLAEIETKV